MTRRPSPHLVTRITLPTQKLTILGYSQQDIHNYLTELTQEIEQLITQKARQRRHNVRVTNPAPHSDPPTA